MRNKCTLVRKTFLPPTAFPMKAQLPTQTCDFNGTKAVLHSQKHLPPRVRIFCHLCFGGLDAALDARENGNPRLRCAVGRLARDCRRTAQCYMGQPRLCRGKRVSCRSVFPDPASYFLPPDKRSAAVATKALSLAAPPCFPKHCSILWCARRRLRAYCDSPRNANCSVHIPSADS